MSNPTQIPGGVGLPKPTPPTDFSSLEPCVEHVNYAALAMPTPPISEITNRIQWKGKTSLPLYNYHMSLSGNHDGLFIQGGVNVGDWQSADLTNNPVNIDDLIPRNAVQVIRWVEILIGDLLFASNNFLIEDSEGWADISSLFYEWHGNYRWLLVISEMEEDDESQMEIRQVLGISPLQTQIATTAIQNMSTAGSKKQLNQGFIQFHQFMLGFAEQLRMREMRILAELEAGEESPVDESVWPEDHLLKIRQFMTEITILRLWHRLRFLERIAFSKNGWATAVNALHYNQLVLCLSKLLEERPPEQKLHLPTGPWHVTTRPFPMRVWPDAAKPPRQKINGVEAPAPAVIRAKDETAYLLPPAIIGITESKEDFPAVKLDIRISLPVRGEQYDEAEAALVEELIVSSLEKMGPTKRAECKMFVNSFVSIRDRQLQQVRQRHIDQCQSIFGQQAVLDFEADLAHNPMTTIVQREELKERYENDIRVVIANEKICVKQLQAEYMGRLMQSGAPTGLVSDRLLLLVSVTSIMNSDWWAQFSNEMPLILARTINALSCCTFDVDKGVDCGLSTIDRRRLLAEGVEPGSNAIENPFHAASLQLEQKQFMLQHQVLQMQRKKEIERLINAGQQDQTIRAQWQQVDQLYREQQGRQYGQFFAPLQQVQTGPPIQPYVPYQRRYATMPIGIAQPVAIAKPVWDQDSGNGNNNNKGNNNKGKGGGQKKKNNRRN